MNPKTHVSIKLSNEARKIVVFEIGRKKKTSELRRVPDHETVLVGTPRDDLVCG